MRIEFRTVYDSMSNEIYGQIYAKHCIDKQLNQLKIMKIMLAVTCVVGFILGLVTENVSRSFVPLALFPTFLIVGLVYINWIKKKLYPKTFKEINGVGCPFNVTYGLYDEYFYEKFENNMCIYENSVRYEFLKKIVETPEYFVLMTKRSGIYFLPKRDMGYENAMEFSAFCKSRLPYIYKIGD